MVIFKFLCDYFGFVLGEVEVVVDGVGLGVVIFVGDFFGEWYGLLVIFVGSVV